MIENRMVRSVNAAALMHNKFEPVGFDAVYEMSFRNFSP